MISKIAIRTRRNRLGRGHTTSVHTSALTTTLGKSVVECPVDELAAVVAIGRRHAEIRALATGCRLELAKGLEPLTL